MASIDLTAAAAHLHVALRRKVGRITDIEWMATDYAYAQAMVALARQKAQELSDDTLAQHAQRLLEAWQARRPPQTRGELAAEEGGAVAPPQRYVWGVRM